MERTMELERAVKARLEVLGISQADCAEILGWTPQRLRGALNSNNPRLSTLRVLAALCAVPVAALVSGAHATASYPVPASGRAHLEKLRLFLQANYLDEDSDGGGALVPDWDELKEGLAQVEGW